MSENIEEVLLNWLETEAYQALKAYQAKEAVAERDAANLPLQGDFPMCIIAQQRRLGVADGKEFDVIVGLLRELKRQKEENVSKSEIDLGKEQYGR